MSIIWLRDLVIIVRILASVAIRIIFTFVLVALYHRFKTFLSCVESVSASLVQLLDTAQEAAAPTLKFRGASNGCLL